MHSRLIFAAFLLSLISVSALDLSGQVGSDQVGSDDLVFPANSIFHVVVSPSENFDSNLLAVSAASTKDIWAVGQSTIHYDGAKWTAFPAPQIHGDNTSYLAGVADFSSTNAWAAGTVNIGEANPNQVIEQWNGTAWNVAQGPTFNPGDVPNLFALTAISSSDMWAAGDILTDDGVELLPLFEHYNGTSWTTYETQSDGAVVFGLSADATNDVWAVGANSLETTFTERWNGSNWSVISSPSPGTGPNVLTGVAALAKNNVWAVGYTTSAEKGTFEAPTLTLIEHWNGSRWSVVPSPNVGPGTQFQSNRLRGIVAVAANDIWAFGSYFASDGSGHQMTLLLHWDGASWTIQPSPNPTQGNFLSDLLYAGTVAAPGNIWIVGAEDAAPHSDTLVLNTTGG